MSDLTIYHYKETFSNFISLFNIDYSIIDEIEESIDSDISDQIYYFFKDIDLDNSEFYNYINYTKSIRKYILDEIENFLDVKVSNCFEDKIEFNILPYENDLEVEFTIKSGNLKNQIGRGMDAYGYFDWNLHSEEDKQSFLDDGYLALRELLHYYEACESKPRIEFNYDVSDFWKFTKDIDLIKKELEGQKNE